jgi:hypothetical protein
MAGSYSRLVRTLAYCRPPRALDAVSVEQNRSVYALGNVQCTLGNVQSTLGNIQSTVGEFCWLLFVEIGN